MLLRATSHLSLRVLDGRRRIRHLYVLPPTMPAGPEINAVSNLGRLFWYQVRRIVVLFMLAPSRRSRVETQIAIGGRPWSHSTCPRTTRHARETLVSFVDTTGSIRVVTQKEPSLFAVWVLLNAGLEIEHHDHTGIRLVSRPLRQQMVVGVAGSCERQPGLRHHVRDQLLFIANARHRLGLRDIIEDHSDV